MTTIKNKILSKSIHTCLVGSILMLSGCNKSIADLDEYFISQREAPPRAIEPIPEVKPYLRYTYPKHEKDPFDVAMLAPNTGPKEIIDNGVAIDSTRVPEFLEGFTLESLKMVGTVKKDNTLWALIKIPDGAVQSVKKGNYIGQNYGEIISITSTKMKMKEIVANGSGGYVEREASIVLNQL